MISSLKQKLSLFMLGLLAISALALFVPNFTEAAAPQFKRDFSSLLKDYTLSSEKFLGSDYENHKLSENIKNIFYPRSDGNTSVIYRVIRDITLGVMIAFIVWAGASLLLNKKPDEAKKHLYSIMYIMLGGVFIYAANRLFGDVLNFGNSEDTFTKGEEGISGFRTAMIGDSSVFFVVLSAIKAFAFFLAIIMIVVTGFKVMAAGEGEKGKKLVKGIINVVVALLIIKGVDFIYGIAADSDTFIQNASDFIINVAKIFGWIYGVIIFIMVLVSGYLYITDGGDGSNFKKASNLLVNILLSALVLFGFLLIVYQIFAEFQTGGDAATDTTSFIIKNYV